MSDPLSLFFSAFKLALIPSMSGLKSFTRDQIPPTTIAPTPRYLILLSHISHAADSGSPSKP